MKQGRARRGKPSSAKRTAAWKERANRPYAQWHVVEIEMGVLVKSSRMTAATQLYHDRLPQLCERLKSSTEPWLQALWRRLMTQHHDASRVLSVIVKQWQLVIRTKHRVIYQLVSTHTATGYCGMDEYRVCIDRHKEYLSSIRDSDYKLRRQEVCIHVSQWWSRSMDIYSLHLLAYTCEETNISNTGVARNPAIPSASEQSAAMEAKSGEKRSTCEPYTCCEGCIFAQS